MHSSVQHLYATPNVRLCMQGFWSGDAEERVIDDDGSPNKFTLNMMDSLRQRTGAGPVIRVGGTVR